jgi:hypothetical protein
VLQPLPPQPTLPVVEVQQTLPPPTSQPIQQVAETVQPQQPIFEPQVIRIIISYLS